MKHASITALDQLEGVLGEIRKHDALKEKKRGVFYRKSSAFLHFHEDPSGLFADLRASSDWERLPANTRDEQRKLLARIAASLRIE
jgi:hypothetical protein